MKAASEPRSGGSSIPAPGSASGLRRWRNPLTAAIAGVVFALLASTASASDLYIRSGQGAYTLVYAGRTNGEVNFVTEQLSGGELVLHRDRRADDPDLPELLPRDYRVPGRLLD